MIIICSLEIVAEWWEGERKNHKSKLTYKNTHTHIYSLYFSEKNLEKQNNTRKRKNKKTRNNFLIMLKRAPLPCSSTKLELRLRRSSARWWSKSFCNNLFHCARGRFRKISLKKTSNSLNHFVWLQWNNYTHNVLN